MWKAVCSELQAELGDEGRHLTGYLARISCSANSSRNNLKQFHKSLSDTGQEQTSGRVCSQPEERPEIS